MSIWKDIFSKLDQRQFEMKETYWRDLEKELDKNSRKSKTRLFLKGLFGVILFLLLTSTAIYFIANDFSKKPDNTAAQTKSTPQTSKNNSHPVKNTSSLNESIAEQHTAAVVSSGTDNTTSSEDVNQTLITGKNEHLKTSPSVKKNDVSVQSSSTLIHQSDQKVSIGSRDNSLSPIPPQPENNKDLPQKDHIQNKKVLSAEINSDNTAQTTFHSDVPTPEIAKQNSQDKGHQHPKTNSSTKSLLFNEDGTGKDINSEMDFQKTSTNEIAANDIHFGEDNPALQSNMGEGGSAIAIDEIKEDQKPGSGKQNTQSDESFDISHSTSSENISFKDNSSGNKALSLNKLEPLGAGFLLESSTPENIPNRELDFVNPKVRPQFFVNLYTGFSYSDKWLQATDPLLEPALTRRQREEHATYFMNWGGEIGMSLKNWNLSTGIGYVRQGEVTRYSPELLAWTPNNTIDWEIEDNSYWDVNNWNFHILTDSSYWVFQDTVITYWNNNSMSYETDTIGLPNYFVNNLDTVYFYRSDSTFIELMDSTKIINRDSVLQTITDIEHPESQINWISYFEVPLMLGYELRLNRLSLMAQSGVAIGFLTRQQMTYLKDDQTGFEQVENSKTNSIIWNYMVRLNIFYYVSESVALSVAPNFRMNLNSVFKDSGFSQRYWNAGINAGVMYRF